MSSYINGRWFLTEAERAALRRAREDEQRRREEQRKRAEERRREERKRASLHAEIREIGSKCLISLSVYDEAARYAKELQSLTGSDNRFSSQLAAFSDAQELLRGDLAGVNDSMDSQTLESVKAELHKSAAASAALKRALEKTVAENKKKLEKTVDRNIASAFRQGLSFTVKSTEQREKEEKERLEDELAKRNLERLFALKNLRVSPELEEKINRSVSASADILCDAGTYQSLVVVPLEKECRAYAAETEKLEKEYEELITKYDILCEKLGKEPSHFTATSVSMELLKKEIEDLEVLTAQAEENEYIAACIDEVMEELGYPVIGHREVTKKSGKHFSSDIYQFEDGSAVNVTISRGGNISMEIGAADHGSRSPSAGEQEQLPPKMEHFCGKYKEIEKKLAERGILLAENIRILPPTSEYAQVFNLDEYETIETACAGNRKQQRKTAKNDKTMRLD